MSKKIDLDDAVKKLQSNENVFIHGGDSTPKDFLEKISARHAELRNLSFYHIHTHGNAPYKNIEYKESFNVKNFFVGGNLRKELNYDNIDYIPCFLSEIPSFFERGDINLDWAIIQVSPPDEHGYVTLGCSVDITACAVKHAKKVIAQVNPNVPRVFGDGVLHISEVDFFYEHEEEIAEDKIVSLSDIDRSIGSNVAELIENGSTLQVGIGNLPDAVLMNLTEHKDLGLHTEMWTLSCMDLIKSGVINNSKKKLYPGKSLSSFIVGNKKLHEFIDNNLRVIQKRVEYVNNPAVIKQNPKVCAINSAVEIDLTGQVCADSVGHRIISGVGGQMDFMRGASLSEGGKAIIAIRSRTKNGQSKIVVSLKEGAGVVTTRSHVNYIVTEFGSAKLRGLSISERAKALIAIAHPEDREGLRAQWDRVYR